MTVIGGAKYELILDEQNANGETLETIISTDYWNINPLQIEGFNWRKKQ